MDPQLITIPNYVHYTLKCSSRTQLAVVPQARRHVDIYLDGNVDRRHSPYKRLSNYGDIDLGSRCLLLHLSSGQRLQSTVPRDKAVS
jgi:hypothetical protein